MVIAPLLVVQLYCACASAGGAGNNAADLAVAFRLPCAWSATVNASKSKSGSKRVDKCGAFSTNDIFNWGMRNPAALARFYTQRSRCAHSYRPRGLHGSKTRGAAQKGERKHQMKTPTVLRRAPPLDRILRGGSGRRAHFAGVGCDSSHIFSSGPIRWLCTLQPRPPCPRIRSCLVPRLSSVVLAAKATLDGGPGRRRPPHYSVFGCEHKVSCPWSPIGQFPRSPTLLLRRPRLTFARAVPPTARVESARVANVGRRQAPWIDQSLARPAISG